jgi:sec-independent protein translocase protein TatA
MRLGPVEIGLILLIVLIVFGVGKLPQVGGALGKGIREFRQAVKGEEEHKPPAAKPEEKKESKSP